MTKEGLKKVGNGIIKVEKGIEKGVVDTLTLPFTSHRRTFGQRAADFIAKWAGSWTFIIGFFVLLGLWIATSGIFILKYASGNLEDPYPFILLNLVLSTLAAVQAPVILMSQNRAAQRDRARADFDYRINKKAEKEIQEIKILLQRKLK